MLVRFKLTYQPVLTNIHHHLQILHLFGRGCILKVDRDARRTNCGGSVSNSRDAWAFYVLRPNPYHLTLVPNRIGEEAHQSFCGAESADSAGGTGSMFLVSTSSIPVISLTSLLLLLLLLLLLGLGCFKKNPSL